MTRYFLQLRVNLRYTLYFNYESEKIHQLIGLNEPVLIYSTLSYLNVRNSRERNIKIASASYTSKNK